MNVIKVISEKQRQDAYHVRKEVFVKEQQVPLELEIDEFEDEATHFVLYDHSTPAGAGRFRNINGIGKVERICIMPDYRGTGAGKKIMLSIEDYAKEAGISQLLLHAQVYAIPFYEKLGYDVTSEEFMDAGIPHKEMIKFLSQSEAC